MSQMTPGPERERLKVTREPLSLSLSLPPSLPPGSRDFETFDTSLALSPSLSLSPYRRGKSFSFRLA